MLSLTALFGPNKFPGKFDMRYFLFSALILMATGLMAQDQNEVAKRKFGKHKATDPENASREMQVSKCTRLMPMTGATFLGGKIIGDGCMGCSVSPVYVCPPVKSGTETRGASGFKFMHREGADF